MTTKELVCAGSDFETIELAPESFLQYGLLS
jgi:hypothetical protein